MFDDAIMSVGKGYGDSLKQKFYPPVCRRETLSGKSVAAFAADCRLLSRIPPTFTVSMNNHEVVGAG